MSDEAAEGVESLREAVIRCLELQNRDKGQVCDTCGHRDGHHLTYCMKCPGRYVEIQETWRQSILRQTRYEFWVKNRIQSFSHALTFEPGTRYLEKNRREKIIAADPSGFEALVRSILGIA